MQDADRPSTTQPPLSLSQWLYQAIAASEAGDRLRLRLRLRGNHLHLLCEGTPLPVADRIVPRLIRALRSPEAEQFDVLAGKTEEPVYKIVLYGRAIGESRPAWIEPIDLEPLRARPLPEAITVPASSRTLAIAEQAERAFAQHPGGAIASGVTASRGANAATLTAVPAAPPPPATARDSPEAIARHLSEFLAPLGVSVRVLVQKLPQTEAGPEPDLKRLWAICSCSYSPDASLIAQPLARQLRELQLEGFKEAAIRLQVSGEATPDWVLQVDLTSPQAMLRDWARWGEVQALERLLDQALRDRGVRVRATLTDGTLHLFCSLRSALGLPQEVPPPASTTAALASVLDDLAPQGITAATVYGVRSLELEAAQLTPDALHEAPVWVQWLQWPAASRSDRAPTAIDLARQLDLAALTFLLQRLLNPNLDDRLIAGGIGIKLCLKEAVLHVMTEALVCPPQVQVVSRIEKLLRHLALPEIGGARIYGRRAGQAAPLWSYTLELAPPTTKSVADVPAESAAAAPEAVAPAAPTADELDEPALTAPPAATSLPQRLQQVLCWTRVFVPRRPTGELDRYSQPAFSRWADDRNLKVAAIWAILGLFLALQVDWALGRRLRLAARQADLQQVSQQVAAEEAELMARQQAFDRLPAPAPARAAERFTAAPPDRRESEAAAAAILAAARAQNPSFNNPLLDEKLALYQERLERGRPPEVLIVGSSRAMRGIDPTVLQEAIAAQGYARVEIFNFGINGATAQTVDWLLRRLLAPEQLPELVIWADGARAFNSGRRDLTYEAIAASEGYRQLEAGAFPGQGNKENTARRPSWTARVAQGFRAGYTDFNRWLSSALGEFSATYPQREQLKTWLHQRVLEPLPGVQSVAALDAAVAAEPEPIDLDGFLAIAARFNPTTYYRTHARVSGAYDSDYASFSLRGRQYQALREVLKYLNQQDVEVVFVNLPLTADYLDPVRRQYEADFVTHMERVAERYDLVFRDLAALWLTEYDYFSDPSHLNRYGAYEVSQYLARDPAIPWEASSD